MSEDEPPWRDIILSLTPTVFTASADWKGLLQRVCERVAVATGCIYFNGFAVMCPIYSLITLTRGIRNIGGWYANPGSISRNNCEECTSPHPHVRAKNSYVF